MKTIAVAGGTSTGKTTFANLLVGQLGSAAVLPLESFFLDKPPQTPIEHHNFEVPAAIDFKNFHKALEDLRAGVPVTVPIFDRRLGKATGSTKVAPRNYIIIEGNYALLHSSIRTILDYSFYLESPPDVMLARFILQNLKDFQYPPDYSIQHFFAYIRPAFYMHVVPTQQFAHLVVDNDYTSQLDVFLNDFFSKYKI